MKIKLSTGKRDDEGLVYLRTPLYVEAFGEDLCTHMFNKLFEK